jgi:uncharacterized protein HemY
MIVSASERMNASVNVLIGLRTVMCFTSDWFHANRSTNVLISIVSINTRISVTMSVDFLAFAMSLIILLITNIFFYHSSSNE